jgi:hypothetical protein
MKKFLVLFSVMFFLASLIGTASADLLVDTSLRNGSYGGATTPDPTVPSNDPNQTCPGIVNSPVGVSYTSGQALINWNFDDTVADSLRYQGTISFTATFDSSLFDNAYPYLLSDNKGYDTWNNGQSAFAAWAARMGEGKIRLAYKFWLSDYQGNWYFPTDANNRLSFDQPHRIGFTWGGTSPNHGFEIWADGVLISATDLPAGVNFPWGTGPYSEISGTNIGLGDNHQRGAGSSYRSALGVTFADLQIWNEYRPMGGTSPPSQTGSLKVQISPSAAAADGAAWRVAGRNWQANNAIVAGLPVGEHLLEFKDAPYWITPVAQMITINYKKKKTIKADYGLVSPTITISAVDPEASESPSNPGLITFSRVGNTSKTLTVNYAVTGLATNGKDYTKLSGKVKIPAKKTSVTLSVKPKNDKTKEGDETIIVTLTDGQGYVVGVPGSATVTIHDND